MGYKDEYNIIPAFKQLTVRKGCSRVETLTINMTVPLSQAQPCLYFHEFLSSEEIDTP